MPIRTLVMSMLRSLTLTIAVSTLASSAPAAGPPLPLPPELEANVGFWHRIYTEIDGQGGLIHDSEFLDVVYEVVHFPKGISTRRSERLVERAKSGYRAILRKLARGKRRGLSKEEARVLALWPPGVSNETLRRASYHLRFQLGQADKFRKGLIRAGVWRPHIEKMLREHGVPVELAALPHVESSYNPKAYSRVGAAGLWQFTRATGRRYLRVDQVVDERLDPYLATVAAARLLRDNRARTGTWPLAITAYNHGATGVRRAERKLGTRDIGVIARRYKGRTFGFASRNFYASFLAALEIDRNPGRYFGDLEPARPVRYETVELKHYYPATSLVRALGIDRDVLRDHNLALRPAVWNQSKYVPRGFHLRVPVGAVDGPLEVALERIPADQRLARQHRDRFYKVRRGDALSTIASRYGVTQGELVALNNLRSRNRIRAGQVLVLPDHAAGGPAPQRPPASGVYEVRRGDTLSRIARRYGIDEGELVTLNRLPDRHHLAVGQRLRLALAPPPAAPPKPPSAAEPPPPPEPTVIAAAPLPVAPVAPEAPVPASPPTVPSLPASPPAEGAPVENSEADLPTAGELVAALDFSEFASEEGPAGEPEALSEDGQLVLAAEPAPAPPVRDVAAHPVPDPSDYAVGPDHRITVQADETLGHYAEWLEVRASTLRHLNRMRPGTPVVIGRHTKLDFSRVSPETFEQRRLAYHRSIQEEFFGAYAVTGTDTHVVRSGESLWYLARRRFSVPVWLLRQYNPDLDFGALKPGSHMVVPRVEPQQG